MSGKRPSGAQQRKRKIEERKEAIKSSKLMKSFLKKKKSQNEENQIDEDDSHQLSDRDEIQSDHDEMNKDLTSKNHSESENKEHTKHGEQLDDNSNESNYALPTNQVPAVLIFSDVGYLEFDETSHLPLISHQLRTEMVSRGSTAFQNRNGPFEKRGGRSMTRQGVQILCLVPGCRGP